MTWTRIAAASTILSVLAVARTPLARAEEAPEGSAPGPFDRGKFGVSIAVGQQDAFDETYLSVGGALGYYVVAGLELGIEAAHWFGGDPSVSLVSPRLRYVFWQVPLAFKPYVGTGYTHWFVGDPFEDVDAVAGRAGLTGVLGGALLLSVGAAVERVVSSCDTDCWAVYPEIGFGITF